MSLSPEIEEKIAKLEEKFKASGQDLGSYLDGLLYADYLTYWDYVHLDTLLSLQNPKTNIPDEEIFIMYHQITELYFKLSLHEIKQISKKEDLEIDWFIERVTRINRYFGALTTSFAVMEKGMEQEQFLKFRMSLLPASGFQSAQYRMIEIGSTDFINLVDKDVREDYKGKDASIDEMYNHIYWQKGATIADTGEKTLTLRQFEQKYNGQLRELANEFKGSNIWARYKSLSKEDQQNENLISAMRQLDVDVNINWPLQHYKTAVSYLARNPSDIPATGGTNWQKYLPPRFQKRIFYPELWTEQDKEEWGKGWVESVLNELKYGKRPAK